MRKISEPHEVAESEVPREAVSSIFCWSFQTFKVTVHIWMCDVRDLCDVSSARTFNCNFLPVLQEISIEIPSYSLLFRVLCEIFVRKR